VVVFLVFVQHHLLRIQKREVAIFGKTVAIISAAIGGVSLILIVVIIYFMTRPVDNVAPLQDKASPLVFFLFFFLLNLFSCFRRLLLLKGRI
jgi:uncharacterized membrane protein